MENSSIRVILEKTNTGYSAYSPDENGIYTTGASFEEIKENLEEVKEMQVEYLREKDNETKANELEHAKLEFFLDVEQFFEHFNMINKSAFAHYIGMNESQLRKISKGIVPLSDNKALQIQNGLHTLARDLGSVHFA